jgi:hypothetical protein
MTGPSPIPGIGGTGGSCSSDQRLSQEVRPYAVRKPAIKKKKCDGNGDGLLLDLPR